MIEIAIIKSIESNQTINAILGTRSWVIEAPADETMPFIVVSRISRTGEDTYTGPTGLATHRIQVDVFARDQIGLDSLANLIRNHIAGIAHQDVVISNDSPSQSVRIQSARQVMETDTAEEQSQPAVRRRVMDWLVTWNEGDVL